MEAINIFTDGSAINNGKKNASGGIGVYIVELNYKLSLPYFIELATNQRCELYAIIKALETYLSVKLKNNKIPNKVIIYSDSMYCINVCTKWIPGWKKQDWKTSEKEDVKNVCLIKQIDKIQQLCFIKGITVEYQFVSSHKDEPRDKKSREHFLWKGNDMVDKLAKSASSNYLKFFFLNK
jgi:ribonuclease HI